VRFLVDRCVGRRLAEWLQSQAHDVLEVRTLGPDPGDRQLLQVAADGVRIVVTLDRDFPTLVFLEGRRQCGMVRLPDVPAPERIRLMRQVLERHSTELEEGAVVTVKGGRIRISWPPGRS
jgi:predicted nuclease of predicted toxin-antitoxin system